MGRMKAVLVEDDSQQAEETIEVLEAAGFSVEWFMDAHSARDGLEGKTGLVEIFIVDRKLPEKIGERALDAHGDTLFEWIEERWPATRILIFSGHVDFDYLQEKTEGAGLLFDDDQTRMSRISVFRKDQTDLFDAAIRSLRDLLSRISDVELRLSGDLSAVSEVDRRVLRCVAIRYQATTLSGSLLSGGLTGAKVWNCEIYRESRFLMHVVVKDGSEATGAVGLAEGFPRAYVANCIARVPALNAGVIAAVLHWAGSGGTPLMSRVLVSKDSDVEPLETLAEAFVALPAVATTEKVSDLVEPVFPWDRAATIFKEWGLRLPSGTAYVSTSKSLSHLDLHPMNVIVCNETPVLIDWDGSGHHSALIDPLTLLLSTLTHPDSPIRGSAWIDANEIRENFGRDDFGANSVYRVWFGAVGRWISKTKQSDREFHAITLAYVARQLEYPDVKADADMCGRLIEIAKVSIEELEASMA